MAQYRFVINEDQEIITIVEHDGSTTFSGEENSIVTTTIEKAKLYFGILEIDITPITDFEATL